MDNSVSRGSNSSANGLLTVTVASPHDDHLPPAVNDDDVVDPDDPFDVSHTKNAPPETLKRWRVRN